MELRELKVTLKEKSLELEWALEHKIPHEELIKLYKELKELQYEIVLRELATTEP